MDGPTDGVLSYYLCDKESDKPVLKTTTPGDLAYVRDTQTLYVADGVWVDVSHPNKK